MTQPAASMTTPTVKKPRVLFICTGNTARSQMAQALLEHRAGHRFEVSSAGLEPGEVNPLTVQALQEKRPPPAIRPPNFRERVRNPHPPSRRLV
ncbi:hypothetical protein [Deinococcus marmoris]|uniref:arsenate reductase/protein-tyrosine-phosphatase family protein n=1 Tax=Deinococcus marmoris TaxID=249408 RepID=UPI000B170E38